jgi:tRNA pseudouridine55 synthase
MFGFINLHKPAACSSRQAVDMVKKWVRPNKVGHAGTLDPLATGVLVVAVGDATRLVEHVQQSAKGYIATFLLGQQSDTEDIEGKIEYLPNAPIVSIAAIQQVLPEFIGKIQQMPPIYSALKINGQPAYKRARRGESVELAPREIVIHKLELVEYAYPQLTLDIHCGSGTYVRSLGRDIAQKLGTAAVMSALVRTYIGPFSLASACHAHELNTENIQQHLLPATLAVAHLPQQIVTPAEIEELRHGRTIWNSLNNSSTEIAVVSATNELIAIVTPKGEKLFPVRVFHSG